MLGLRHRTIQPNESDGEKVEFQEDPAAMACRDEDRRFYILELDHTVEIARADPPALGYAANTDVRIWLACHGEADSVASCQPGPAGQKEFLEARYEGRHLLAAVRAGWIMSHGESQAFKDNGSDRVPDSSRVKRWKATDDDTRSESRWSGRMAGSGPS